MKKIINYALLIFLVLLLIVGHLINKKNSYSKKNEIGNFAKQLNIRNKQIAKIQKNLLLASNKAGHAINTTRTSLNHAISYPLTNLYDLQHGLACAFSIPGIVSLFENDLKQIKEYELIKASLSLISKLELKEYYKPHLKNIDIELVSEQILINARSKNFIYDITKDNIKNILNTSKKFFLD